MDILFWIGIILTILGALPFGLILINMGKIEDMADIAPMETTSMMLAIIFIAAIVLIIGLLCLTISFAWWLIMVI